MTNADQALEKVLGMDFRTVLDVGSGGVHADIFRDADKDVTTNNLTDADYVGDYLCLELGKFDCIWASHVLEHQPNPNLFLKKCFRELNDNGILAITVPPMKNNIVGGHVTVWNAGLLLYQLILAGFNCVNASVKTYGYNVSVIVRKHPFIKPELKMDYGDIEALSIYFPVLVCNDGFNGDIKEINW